MTDIPDEAQIDSGIRYCLTHHAIIEQDATVCDETEPGECVSRPLVYLAALSDEARQWLISCSVLARSGRAAAALSDEGKP
jgi:hypothetical protein